MGERALSRAGGIRTRDLLNPIEKPTLLAQSGKTWNKQAQSGFWR